MSIVTGKLTIFFEEPFWVGVFEREENGKLSAAKVTFGAKPTDGEIYGFVSEHYYDLKFSPGVSLAVGAMGGPVRKNPKRTQREVKKQLAAKGVGTKSQQALKLQQEQNKQERKVKSRREKEAEAARRFEQRKKKKKEKHRGR